MRKIGKIGQMVVGVRLVKRRTIWYRHHHNQLYQLIQLLKMQILSVLMMRYIIRLQLYIDFLNFRAVFDRNYVTEKPEVGQLAFARQLAFAD
jgi:hypothetical protein